MVLLLSFLCVGSGEHKASLVKWEKAKEACRKPVWLFEERAQNSQGQTAGITHSKMDNVDVLSAFGKSFEVEKEDGLVQG